MRGAAVLAAVAAIGLCGASQGPPANADQAKGGHPKQHSETVAPLGGSKAASGDQEGARGLSPYERESLAIDRQANAIAEAQRSYDFGQLISVILTGLIAGFAAYFAWRATHWAKNAAEVSQRALEATHIAERRQLRAYVGVLSANVRNLDGVKPVEVEIRFKNAGATPARKLNVRGGMFITTYPDGPQLFGDLGAFAYRPTMVLPGGETRKTEKGAVPKARLAELKAGRAVLYVYGVVTYEDVFGCEWETPYRLFCGGGHPNWLVEEDGKVFGRLAPAEEGNEST